MVSKLYPCNLSILKNWSFRKTITFRWKIIVLHQALQKIWSFILTYKVFFYWKKFFYYPGIGFCMIAISFLVSVYNISFLVWIFYFLFHSFSNPLPWQNCNNIWNTQDCLELNASHVNVTGTSPSEEFFKWVIENTINAQWQIHFNWNRI